MMLDIIGIHVARHNTGIVFILFVLVDLFGISQLDAIEIHFRIKGVIDFQMLTPGTYPNFIRLENIQRP